MIVEIVTTGTDLLLGEIYNESSRDLAQILNQYGYTIAYMTTVDNNPVRMERVIMTALERADIVITTGGLGATAENIIKQAGADALGRSLTNDESEYSRLQESCNRRGMKWNKNREKEALFLKGADLLQNDWGGASGAAYEYSDGKALIHLPGLPSEMRTMTKQYLIPWLNRKFGDQGVTISKIMTVESMTESDLALSLKAYIKKQSNPTITLLVRPGFTVIRLTAHEENREKALQLLETFSNAIAKIVPVTTASMYEDPSMEVFSLLKQYKLTLSAAESCTGGWIGKLLTDPPGSSVYFKGSAVTYWNEAKERILHVKSEDIKNYTAVSIKVAAQMAKGSRFLYNSDIAVSTTGYAGPGLGERGEKPGIVYIGISGPYGTVVYKERFHGNRECVRLAACRKALFRMCSYIKKHQNNLLFV